MNDLQLHIKGVFRFTGNQESNFTGPVKRGFRPIAWGKDVQRSTSVSFVSNIEIELGATREVEIVLLSASSVDIEIAEGNVLSIGSVSHKIGEFQIKHVIGNWRDKKLP